MIKVSIVFSSGRGSTRTVAEHVYKGAAAFTACSAELIEIIPAQLGPDGRWHDQAIMDRLAASDAILFGAPTYMGSAHGLFKLFLDAGITPWVDQSWKDKIAAGFTNSGSRSGDKLIALQQMSIFAVQMGMVWVGIGERRAAISPKAARFASCLGQRVWRDSVTPCSITFHTG